MTEGARNFRRRGAVAHRSPWPLVKNQVKGLVKSEQLNEANAKALHLEVSAHAAFVNRGIRRRETFAAEFEPGKLGNGSSVIDLGGELQLLDVTAFRRNPGKKSGEKASRGAPQTMPQRAWLLLTNLVYQVGQADSGNSRALVGSTTKVASEPKEVQQLGTCPCVRSRVAELDDGVAVPLFRGNSKRNEARLSDSDEARSEGRVGGGSTRRGKAAQHLAP